MRSCRILHLAVEHKEHFFSVLRRIYETTQDTMMCSLREKSNHMRSTDNETD